MHWEDQLASEKKCGHLGGKVLIRHNVALTGGAATVGNVFPQQFDLPSIEIKKSPSLEQRILQYQYP